MQLYIVIQVITVQETATDTQQDSDQHQTTANDAASEQQSSVQHQPTPQYALLNYKPKDKEVSSNILFSYINITTYNIHKLIIPGKSKYCMA